MQEEVRQDQDDGTPESLIIGPKRKEFSLNQKKLEDEHQFQGLRLKKYFHRTHRNYTCQSIYQVSLKSNIDLPIIP